MSSSGPLTFARALLSAQSTPFPGPGPGCLAWKHLPAGLFLHQLEAEGQTVSLILVCLGPRGRGLAWVREALEAHRVLSSG